MMGIALPLAEFMARLAGTRSWFRRLRPLMSRGPARQLWQPVSARAVVAKLCRSSLRVCPCTRKSSLWVETFTSMFGWGGERRWVHWLVVESHDWCGRVPSDMVWMSSEMALSCSASLSQHMWAKWFGRLHEEHVEPKAGHCVLLMAVRSRSPWPWRPQKQQVALLLVGALLVVVCPLFGVGWVLVGVVWGRLGLKGVALGGLGLCWRR